MTAGQFFSISLHGMSFWFGGLVVAGMVSRVADTVVGYYLLVPLSIIYSAYIFDEGDGDGVEALSEVAWTLYVWAKVVRGTLIVGVSTLKLAAAADSLSSSQDPLGFFIFLCAAPLALGLLFTPRRAGGAPNNGHIRGRRVSPDGRGIRQVTALGTNEPWFHFGGELVPLRFAKTGLSIVGDVGSGKTTIAKLLLKDILPHCRRSIVYDPKTELVSYLGSLGVPVRILDVFDRRGLAWRIADDVTDEDTATEVSQNLIQQLPEGKEEPFWSLSAQQLVAALFTLFHERAPGEWTLRDVVLGCSDIYRLRYLLSLSPSTEKIGKAYFADERTAKNAHTNLVSRLQPYRTVAAAWHYSAKRDQTISLREFAEATDGSCLVLGENPAKHATAEAVNRVLFRRLANLLLPQNQSHVDELRTFVSFDELNEAPDLAEPLIKLLTMGRSYGVGVSIMLQGIEGLIAKRGEKEANSILAKPGFRIYLKLSSNRTAKYAAEDIGQEQFSQITKSWNKDGDSFSRKPVIEDSVLPSELMTVNPINVERGIDGYYLGLGNAWRYTLPFSHWPPLKVDGEANFEPRPSAEFRMPRWTISDLERLGLPTDDMSLKTLDVGRRQRPRTLARARTSSIRSAREDRS